MDIGEIPLFLPYCMPEGSETITGYKMYMEDAITNKDKQAETLPDQNVLKSSKDAIRIQVFMAGTSCSIWQFRGQWIWLLVF